MNIITPQALHEQMKGKEKLLLLDVRTSPEFSEKHIAGSVLFPFEDLDVDEAINMAKDYDRCVIYCLSGKRAIKAASLMSKRGYDNADVVDGGIKVWEQQGLPLVVSDSNGIPIMRQVQMIVATGISIGLVLAFTVNLWFLAIPIFFALGLTYAGLSGKCGMAYVLAKMPWNQNKSDSCGIY